MSEQGHAHSNPGPQSHRQQEEEKCNKPDVQDEKRGYDGVNPVTESLHAVLAEGFIGQVSVKQHGVWTLLHRA